MGNTLEGTKRRKTTLNPKIIVTMQHTYYCSVIMAHSVYKSTLITGLLFQPPFKQLFTVLTVFSYMLTVKILAGSPNLWSFFVVRSLLAPNCTELYPPWNSIPWPALFKIPSNRRFIHSLINGDMVVRKNKYSSCLPGAYRHKSNNHLNKCKIVSMTSLKKIYSSSKKCKMGIWPN